MRFTFDGRAYTGLAGDTLASALIANGVSVVGRSFKYHRPRGIFSAGAEEPNALVQLETGSRTEPNLRATQVELVDGLVARSVNAFPSAAFDLRAVNDLFSPLLPAGFYYKTFMWPTWHVFEGSIRRAAGLGYAPNEADPDCYEHRSLHCDLLVVGAGPAGLTAALAAARSGASVAVIDENSRFGGSLLSVGDAEFENALPWIAKAYDELEQAGATLLSRTIGFGYYDHNLIGAVQHLLGGAQAVATAPRQRLWKIRARRVVLATGAHERPLVFRNNDRPGVMLASAVARYVHQYAVKPGKRAVVFTNNDTAYEVVRLLLKAGVEVAAVIDTRLAVSPSSGFVADTNVEMIRGAAVTDVSGRSRVASVTVTDLVSGRSCRIECDLVAVSGGWSPAAHLHSQSGGTLRFCNERLMFVPDKPAQGSISAGSANGATSLIETMTQGWQAGAQSAVSLGLSEAAIDLPALRPPAELLDPEAWSPSDPRKAFVDLANDVTAADIQLAARENYVSVEHLKRYTTLGMGTDQGKTSNINGLLLLGRATNRSPSDVGTTKFRPPYTPVTLGAICGPYRGDLSKPRRYLPAHAWHIERGALFEEFAGWERPAAYPAAGESLERAATREALHVRNEVGIFDGSPLGKIEISGPDAGVFLDRLYVGTASSLQVGRARYGLMLNENGVIIDDGVFARLSAEKFLVHTTSGGAERIAAMAEEWLQCEWPDLDVVVANVTAQWANLTLSGPKARDLLQVLAPSAVLSPSVFPHMSMAALSIGGVGARVARVSFTGELSYEINVPARYGESLFRYAWEAGEPLGLRPYGIEALMILRTEKGYLHIGSDTDGTTLPADVGLGTAVAKKASDFIGRRSLTRADGVRPDRLQLVGLATSDPSKVLPIGAQVLRDAAPPCDSDGFVTSSYFSPALKRSVALGLVRAGRSRLGASVRLYDMGQVHDATIVKTTFYDPEGRRLDD